MNSLSPAAAPDAASAPTSSSLVSKTLRFTAELFGRHPAESGETYLVHLWFTFKISLRFLMLCIIVLLHGLFPFLFKRTASKQIAALYEITRRRVPQADGTSTQIQYEI